METSTANLTEIPDHLVAEIFLRLPAAEDLARASAACVSFRRLVTDKSFLRRLHDPPILAICDGDGFHHALPPHPSTDFSFSFLPKHLDWAVQDGRVLLLLLLRREGEQPKFSTELAVCDPLHRKYVLLPPVPDDLVASMAHLATKNKPWCEAFLVPLDQDAEAAFGVMWMAHFKSRLASLFFSSSSGQWQAAASKEWSELFLQRGEPTIVSPINRTFHQRHYAYGCFYWESTLIQNKELLVLDSRTMEFSISDLPPREWCTRGLAIVEVGEGRLGLFGILGISPRRCQTWIISQLTSRRCSLRGFMVVVLPGFTYPRRGYIPTSRHRSLHRQYEVIRRSSSQINIRSLRAPCFLCDPGSVDLVQMASPCPTDVITNPRLTTSYNF